MVKSRPAVIFHQEQQLPHQTAPKIELSARVRKIVEEIARQRSTEYRLVVRASLILAMAAGAGLYELTRTQKLDRGTVRAWRGRWSELAPKLAGAEASEVSAEDLRDLVLTGLMDLPRSGTPPTFTAEQLVQIVAVACEEPSHSQRPISHSRASGVGRRSRQTQNRRAHFGVECRALFKIRSLSNRIELNTGLTHQTATRKNVACRSKRSATSTNRPRNCTRKAFIW